MRKNTNPPDRVRNGYIGYTMMWELWAAPILDYLTERREARAAATLEVIQTVMRLLYYQDGLYLTVPGDIRRAIVKWAYQYLKDGAAPFPFAGSMGSDSYQFTVDFERDTSLKENINIHADMGTYNAAHNAEKASRRTAKRFADLIGDRWTTAELRAQGFSDRNARRLQGLHESRFQPPLLHQRMRKGLCVTADQSTTQEALPPTNHGEGKNIIACPLHKIKI